ncbi:MAG: flippase [Candidatus Caenarcaniphilales bacterium]|nr:flippase [Candidatus Caenarcaniphilales bacterium]
MNFLDILTHFSPNIMPLYMIWLLSDFDLRFISKINKFWQSLKEDTLKGKTTRNILWLGLERVVRLMVSVFTTALLARYLDLVSFGKLNFVLAFVSLFGLFTALGLKGIVVRELLRQPEGRFEILGTSFGLRLGMGLLTYVMSFALIRLLKPGDPQVALLVGIMALSLFLQSFDVIDTWFKSLIEARNIVLVQNIASIVSSAVKIALIYIGASLTTLVWAHLLEFGLVAIGYIILYKSKENAFLRWSFNWKRAKFLIGQSWMMLFASGAAFIYTKIDLIMLAKLASPESLGIYSATVRLAEVFDYIPLIIFTSVLPTAVARYSESWRSFALFTQKIFDFMIMIWLGISIMITLTAPWLIGLIFGPKYQPAAQLLAVYIWGLFGSCLGLARTIYVNVKNLYRVSLVVNLIGLVLNISLNLILIPRFEALGATVATLITYLVTTIVLNFYFREFRVIAIFLQRALQFNLSLPRLWRAIDAA